MAKNPHIEYSDKGKPLNLAVREVFKPDLDSAGVEFFRYPISQAFTVTSYGHYHEAIECLYVEKGELTVYIDEAWRTVPEGGLILLRSMGIHAIITEESRENIYYVLKIMPTILYNITPKSQNNAFPLRFTAYSAGLKSIWTKDEIRGTAIELGLKRLLCQLDLDGKSTASDLTLTVSALTVMEGLYESDKREEPLIKSSETLFKAVSYVEGRLAERLTEEEVARHFGISPSHFAREFKRTTGKTFRQYIISARMRKAEKLLATKAHSVREVAELCGYSSVSHFITSYRRLTGKTPASSGKS